MSSRVALVLATLLLAGCPQDEKGIRFQFPRILEPSSNCSTASSTDILPLKDFTVRLSFMRRRGKQSGSSWVYEPVNGSTLTSYDLVCDRVFPPSTPGTEVDIAVPVDAAGSKLTVRAEAFYNGGSGLVLEYAGQAEDVELSQLDGKVFVRPVMVGGVRPHSGFSCVAEPAIRRAFHSATALPNGGVLIAGGLVADTGSGASSTIALPPPAKLSTTAIVEIYEPVSQQFLVVGDLLRRRAFHQAFLLPSSPEGPYYIMFLGGLTAKTSAKPNLGAWLRQSELALPFLFSADNDVGAAPAELIIYTPGAPGAPGSLERKSLDDLPRALFPTAVLAANGLAIVGAGGGAILNPAYDATGTTAQADRGFPSDVKLHNIQLGPKGSYVLRQSGQVLPAHVGGAIAQLDDKRFLLVGGNMVNGSNEIGQVLPSDVAGAIAPISAPPPQAVWHTLTPIGDAKKSPAVLWAGGYLLDDDVAPATQRLAQKAPRTSSSIQWIDKDLAIREVTAASYLSTGYHEALRLGTWGVLLVGGNSGACGSQPFCPSTQVVALRWDGSAPTLVTSANLDTPRLGHRVTRLVDGSAMITGGISSKDKKDPKTDPIVTRVAEVFQLRTGLPDDDLFTRLPGKDSKDSGKDSVGDKRCKLRSEVSPP